MQKKSEKPTRKPRKKPKLTLLQIMFLIGAIGMILITVQQHGGF